MHPGGRTASPALARLSVAGDFDFAMGASKKKKPRYEAGPGKAMLAFDLLELDAEDLGGLPLGDRKKRRLLGKRRPRD